MGTKKRILILCAHLHEDRRAKRDMADLQPMIGAQIAGLLAPMNYEIDLHLEFWHGPYEAASHKIYDIILLSGLQADFDRMRQLSFYFRRVGTTVAAGGSICTLFPEFATEFFDVVCAGDVETVVDLMHDYEKGEVKKIYRRPSGRMTSYVTDYGILTKSGVSLPFSHVEASRGCDFKCDFCSIPAENRRHIAYPLEQIKENIDNAIQSSPLFSIRRLLSYIFFNDNNFSNDSAHLRAVCEIMKSYRRIKVWGALITQNVLSNRDIIDLMAESKCGTVFVGIESFDDNFIKGHRKLQNNKNSTRVLEDIAYAESKGILVAYGYLFDPRMMNIEEMKRHLDFILNSDVLNFPYFLSFVSPLVGTKLFWDCAESNQLLPNLRLRDLDGRCIAYSNCKDSLEVLSEFARTIFVTPWVYIHFPKMLWFTLKKAWRFRRPLKVSFLILNRLRLFTLGRHHRSDRTRNYIGGREILDPQYSEFPSSISTEDKKRYFDPIEVTDHEGNVVLWLDQYRPERQDSGQSMRKGMSLEYGDRRFNGGRL